MRVSDFHFDLPEDLIAQHPPVVRGSSRMLVLDRATGALTDEQFAELPQFLEPGDLLILNDSRVLPARLFATRAGLATQHNSPRPSGLIEVLLTEQLSGQEPGQENVWNALVKPARKVLPGEVLHFAGSPTSSVILSAARRAQSKDPCISSSPTQSVPHSSQRDEWDRTPLLTATVVAAGDFGERTLRFASTPDFYAILSRIGHMPLPPYIRRDQAIAPDALEDQDRYQTVYSDKPGTQNLGSAAAPTAGLHFTPEILDALTARGVEIQYLTLHVGLGTFQPVRVSELKDIRLHAERYTLPAATADALNRALRLTSGQPRRRILAVGTTTTRTLEHIAAQALQQTTNDQQPARILPHSGSTSIFLGPGHRFRIISGLLTNFHLPESTLLMLVSAFAGDTPNLGAPCLASETWVEPSQRSPDPDHGRQTILAAYAHAIRERYRFYSYGDCMLLL